MLHRVLFLPSFIMGEKTEKRNVYKNGAHFHNQLFLPPSSHVKALAFTLSRVCLANQVGGEEAAENLFSRSADAQVKRMRKWFWSRWPIHQTRPRDNMNKAHMHDPKGTQYYTNIRNKRTF
jgi:hypothetical protein